jgi:hypothetical protein
MKTEDTMVSAGVRYLSGKYDPKAHHDERWAVSVDARGDVGHGRGPTLSAAIRAALDAIAARRVQA